jgi:hypothetical protein
MITEPVFQSVPGGLPAPAKGFAHINNDVLFNRALSVPVRIYFAILEGHANKERTCFPGKERLAMLMHCTVRQIHTYNAQLVAADLLAIERTRYQVNHYRLPPAQTAEGRFVRMPRKLLYDGTLSAGARLAYAVILHYQRQDVACLRRVRVLAETAGVPVRSMERWIAELRRAGLLETQRHKGKAADRHATIAAPSKKVRQKNPNCTRQNGGSRSDAAQTATVPCCPDRLISLKANGSLERR